MLCLVAVSRVPLPQMACGRGWRKLRTRVALSVGLAWRFASDSGGENIGPGTLALHFGVKRQSGQTRRMLVTTSASEELLMGLRGHLAMAKPVIAKTPTANGTNYQITAGSLESAREVLEGAEAQAPGHRRGCNVGHWPGSAFVRPGSGQARARLRGRGRGPIPGKERAGARP